jgi:hypothetical protein
MNQINNVVVHRLRPTPKGGRRRLGSGGGESDHQHLDRFDDEVVACCVRLRDGLDVGDAGEHLAHQSPDQRELVAHARGLELDEEHLARVTRRADVLDGDEGEPVSAPLFGHPLRPEPLGSGDGATDGDGDVDVRAALANFADTTLR